jgi:outer membrane lipopolysaccharide assembly protein LptE/RlpB
MKLLLSVAILGLAGCGYHLAGAGGVPEGTNTIGIRLFSNHTREVGLEVRLQRAIEDEFRRRGPLRVVDDKEADVVLTGDIRRFSNVPVAFSATDEAVQYQGVMQVGLRLVERRTKKVVRQIDALQAAQDFGAVTGTVIATSPHFQRGTIDARDLPSLTNVQIGLTRRHEAIIDLVDQMARDVYSQAMEGF